MGNLSQEQKDSMRERGFSEHEIIFQDAEKQKEYEPLLKDPTTPEGIIGSIVDSITLVPLKILALKHPNIGEKWSQSHILEKADKKPYQKELIEAFISNGDKVTPKLWIRIRTKFNTAQRFDNFVIELLEEQNDIFTTKVLDIVLNTIIVGGTIIGSENFLPLMEAIFKHKNFNESIIGGDLFNKYSEDIFKRQNLGILELIENSEKSDKIKEKLYHLSGDTKFISGPARKFFVFPE